MMEFGRTHRHLFRAVHSAARRTLVQLSVGSLVAVFGISSASPTVAAAAPSAAKADFVKDVQPIFARHCYQCHGPEKQKAGLRVDINSVALKFEDQGRLVILPGDSAHSPLIRFVSGTDPKIKMPASGEPLSVDEIATLRAWIDQGAAWPDAANARSENRLDHWSFQPIAHPTPPGVLKQNWVRNPIDSFTLARLEKEGLSPSPEADRRTLLRRIYFDLIGLPPTPEEVDAFVADKEPDAYDKVVGRLLASPRYGERWARHWLDVVRFADSHGFETNQPRPNAWRFRDYVIDSLNDDKPFDKFVREQIAGDFFGADVGTSFLVGGAMDGVKSPDINLTSQQRADELHDMVATTGSAFLGLTTGCARCHDHKFDPISQKDYYRLTGVFAGVNHGERGMRDLGGTRDTLIAAARKRLGVINAKLATYEPLATPGGRITLVDDARMRQLVPALGRQPYADGTARGQKSDPGESTHLPNLGRGYLYWNDVAGKEVLAYTPGQTGKYRIWLSWGCGWNTHAPDSVFVLDSDGDPRTQQDRVEIARVDQRNFADGASQLVTANGKPAGQPLWSGFYDAGVHDLTANSRIILRAGATPAYVSADVMVLEAVPADASVKDAVAVPAIRGGIRPNRNVDRFAPVPAKLVRFTALETNNGAEPCIDELEIYTAGDSRNVAAATLGTKATASGTYPNNPSHTLEHINDGQFGNGRSWISNTAGTGWVQLELPKVETIDRVVWGRDLQLQFRDRVPTRYRIEVATEPGKWQTVATADDRLAFAADGPAEAIRANPAGSTLSGGELAGLLSEKQSLDQKVSAESAGDLAYAGTFSQPGPTFLLYRGEPMQPREQVAPGALSQIGPHLDLAADDAEQDRRVKLAEWITDLKNPLTARVIANRLWHYHFGVGIVSTPSDLGRMGARPTHPELLDWMASELTSHGWSLKYLHRLIVTSATYRQASAARPDAAAKDAANALLWRYAPRRLEAEPLRDSILFVSGKLDLRMGGPGYNPFKPNNNYVLVYEPKDEFGPEDWRRMIYQFKPRIHQDGTFGAFDCPDAAQIAPKRTSSTTPLQALNLLNGGFVMQQSAFLADRIRVEAGADEGSQATRAFELVFQRAPTVAERDAAKAFSHAYGLAALSRALLNANEFLYVF